MKDLSRERIAELLQFPHNIQVDEIRPLLSMASRSVSEETVRKLAEHLETRGSLWSRQVEATGALVDSVVRDLRPAAESLNRGKR